MIDDKFDNICHALVELTYCTKVKKVERVLISHMHIKVLYETFFYTAVKVYTCIYLFSL